MCIFYRKKEKEKETNWHFLEFKFCKLTVIDGGEKGICCVFCFLEKKMVQNWLVKSGWNFVTMDKNYCNFFFFLFWTCPFKNPPCSHFSPISTIFLSYVLSNFGNFFDLEKSVSSESFHCHQIFYYYCYYYFMLTGCFSFNLA